jgi:NTP pyrophosphatase (non-canonical NTP hydrolase)
MSIAVAEATTSDDSFAHDVSEVLHDLGAEIVAINAANGWDVVKPEDWTEPYKVPAYIALATSEASEALEGFRHGNRANFEEELADTLIRVLDLSHGLGVDIGAAVMAKLAKNRTRGYRHGGKRV